MTTSSIERRIEEGRYPFGPGRTGWPRYIGPLLGLLWLAIPIVHSVQSEPSAIELVLMAVGLTAFGYLYLSRVGTWSEGLRGPLASVVGMVVVATVLTWTVDESWGTLYAYAAAAAGLRLPARFNGLAVVAITGVAAAAMALAGSEGGTVLALAGITFGIGAIFLLVGSVVRVNAALREARSELAELAVAEERLRFARDLHDLLGHDLSLIALKAELAGKLLPERVDRAAAEVDDIKTLTRSALTEVREAVSDYRRPTLIRELAGARVALEAAGIELSVDDPSVSLEPQVESVLAWAVREGATNVIRHSGARHAAISVRPSLAAVEVEVDDDGRGAPASNGAGHGLDGLRERAIAVGGRVDAGARREGGFRLRVSVPAHRGEAAA
jgi:two-component system sensor histidine kinase DesK